VNFWPAGGFTSLVPIVAAAMVGSLFSMDAWNNVGFASGELKNPEKDLPFAMSVGVLVVVLLYVLANVAYLNVLPADVIAKTWTEGRPPVGTAAMQQMFGQAGLTIMAIAIMISTFGCNNGLILSGARVYYAMARDNLSSQTGELHPAHRTPTLALIVQAIWTSLLALGDAETCSIHHLRGRPLLHAHRGC
jgi:APA family basic amino acid/polyamine antiporter